MEATEAPAHLDLMRRGARAFLDIPAEASADDVRRACLQRLEDDEFHPSEDVRTAIELLVGEAPPTVEELSHARRLSRCVERIVRDKLAPVALRLRSEPGAAVLPALEKLRSEADLFPGTKNWRERLVGMAGLKIPSGLRDKDRQRLIDALVESATTWPGSVAAVRRRLLTEVDAVHRFRTAARKVESRHAKIGRLDPLLMDALKKESIRLVERGDAARAGYVVNWKALFFQWEIPAGGWLVLVPILIALQFIPFQSSRPKRRVLEPLGSTWGSNHPPFDATNESRVNPPASRNPGKVPEKLPAEDFPKSFPPNEAVAGTSRPTPVKQHSSDRLSDLGVFAPMHLNFNDRLIPGDVVEILGTNDFEPGHLGLDVRNLRSNAIFRVNPGIVVSYEMAQIGLLRSVIDHPLNPAVWIAYGNLMSEVGGAQLSDYSFQRAQALGAEIRFQTAPSGKRIAIPQRSETSPPPPLPEGAR